VIVLGICSEAAVFRDHGVLELEDKAYFKLYGDPSPDALPADLIPFRVVFTATGVATFWPDRLEAVSPSYPTCYRFEGWLYKEYTSSDGVRLYSTSEESPGFV
jgi:hypothetical protein